MGRTDWLGSAELRVGLGCMRLSTDADRDEERALATVAAAVDAGISVFDTARAYGLDEGDAGHNERLLARALRRSGAAGRARIVTKGGMARDGGRWLPDGRASRLRADCEASLVALDGLPIDLYLVPVGVGGEAHAAESDAQLRGSEPVRPAHAASLVRRPRRVSG